MITIDELLQHTDFGSPIEWDAKKKSEYKLSASSRLFAYGPQINALDEEQQIVVSFKARECPWHDIHELIEWCYFSEYLPLED